MTTAAPAGSRVASVDALRGLVMIIMALDHTREYFHADALLFQPEDITRTSVVLFFTRWVTHICAPVFFFTAGLGAFFWMQRGRTLSELSRFLWVRGLWLMVLELTVLRLAMNFSLLSGPVVLTVLWAIGLSMVTLALLARLPVRVLAALSILTIALHNLADGLPLAKQLGSAGWVWNIVHQPGFARIGGVNVLVAYTLISWVAVMAAGFCLGPLMAAQETTRRKWLLRLGLGTTAAFFVVRAINVYGDPFPWSAQSSAVMTALSFLRCNKYPPSLDFVLMTLGPALLLLAAMDGRSFSKRNPLIIFGRVPLFYFLAHLFLIHALTIPFALARYGRADFLFHPLPTSGGPADLYPQGFGYSLWVVYAVWAFVVCAMYPLCAWFARVKERHPGGLLSYF